MSRVSTKILFLYASFCYILYLSTVMIAKETYSKIKPRKEKDGSQPNDSINQENTGQNNPENEKPNNLENKESSGPVDKTILNPAKNNDQQNSSVANQFTNSLIDNKNLMSATIVDTKSRIPNPFIMLPKFSSNDDKNLNKKFSLINNKKEIVKGDFI